MFLFIILTLFDYNNADINRILDDTSAYTIWMRLSRG